MIWLFLGMFVLWITCLTVIVLYMLGASFRE